MVVALGPRPRSGTRGEAQTYTSRYISIDKCLYNVVTLGSVRKLLKTSDWYTAREASELLDGEVTEATIKEYCKNGKLDAKKVGPRKRWVVLGASLKKLRQKWGMD